MSEPRILLCGCASAGADPARALSLVEQVALPAGERLVLTTGKFDARKRARTLNVEAGRSASLVALQNRFRCADEIDARMHHEDGFDVLAIADNVDRLSGFDLLVLMRTEFKLPASWTSLMDQLYGRHYLLFGNSMHDQEAEASARNILIDLRDPEKLFLLALRDLFETGSTFAFQPYSLGKVLHTVADALGALARMGQQAPSLPENVPALPGACAGMILD